MLELLTVLTHVATQITGVWLPPPITEESTFPRSLFEVEEKFLRLGIHSLEAEDWVSIMESDRVKLFPVLGWLEVMSKLKKLSIKSLATSAVENFQSMAIDQGHYVSIFSPNYPTLLRMIAKPPLLLFYKGNIDLLKEGAVAVIGSRKANYSSLRMTVEVGMKLAQESICVISGGAIGCDIAVHEGMLASGVERIKPVIVFAGGLHQLHPKSNERAFKELLANGGLLLSEKLWCQKTYPSDFPARNRIVSGMSESIVVMSAGLGSGSLITAHEALEQGREVVVFAKELDDVRMDGSQALLTDGATPFSTPDELINILNRNIPITPEKYFNCAHETCQLANELGTFETEHFIN